jgi:hypothetical protein
MMTTMTAPAAPDGAREQRLAALARANSVRSARRRLKQALRATPKPEATDRTARLVRQPETVTATMKVADLLMACPGMGPTATGKLLRRLHISPSKTLGGLSPRQRDQLGVALDEIARRRRQSASCR